MKEGHIDIDKMVMRSHYLHALEIEDSRGEESMCEMEREEYLSIIGSQQETISELRGLLSSLKEMVGSLRESEARKERRIEELTGKIDCLTASLSISQEQIDRLRDDLYGKKSQSNRHKGTRSSRKSLRKRGTTGMAPIIRSPRPPLRPLPQRRNPRTQTRPPWTRRRSHLSSWTLPAGSEALIP